MGTKAISYAQVKNALLDVIIAVDNNAAASDENEILLTWEMVKNDWQMTKDLVEKYIKENDGNGHL
jgi:hypothetical protein